MIMMSGAIFPVRGDVEWFQSESGNIEIILKKDLSRFEGRVANFLGAPTSVRRPLDEMNSSLWALMDGSTTVEQIIVEMDKIFAERIAPVAERVSRSIAEFVELDLVVLLHENECVDWDIGPSNM